MKKIVSTFICKLLLLYSMTFVCYSQNIDSWNGKKCAVVLTYDDALPQHLDNAVPVLDSLGLKASFYLTAYFTTGRLNDWKKLAEEGHELGNHTLFHPCEGGKGREWVKPEYDLRNYTIQRMLDEIRMTNVFLHALDGKTERTFAFTCGDMKIGNSVFVDSLKNEFIAARAVRNQMHKLNEVDLYNVDCYMVNGENSDQMIAWVKKAMETNSLLVILFHGVGGGNALNVELTAHREFLNWLKQNEKEIWIAPLIEVASFIKDIQQ